MSVSHVIKRTRVECSSKLEDLSSRKDGLHKDFGEFIGCLPAGISRTMQDFADEEVNRGFKDRVIKTLSGEYGVYSEEGFKRALSVENEQELASLSPGAFFQRVDSLAQRVLNSDEYSALPHSTTSTRYENLNRLLKEKNDRALEALGNALRRQIPTTPHRAEGIRAWFSDLSNQEQLSAIRQIDLSNQNLEVIPPEIGQLGSLKVLNLSNNQISVIPPEIGQLGNLQWLYLYNNQISVIPPEISHLVGLEVLTLSHNQIREIPAEIGQLGNLKSLNLENNEISVIPAEIGQLGNLQWLWLSHNQIREIPPEIGQLENLERLGLDRNQIKVIPPEIGHLGGLEELNLSNNQLTQLPASLGALVGNLTSFNLSNQTPPEFKINY